MPILSAKKVSYAYDKKHQAINELDLSVEKGEYVALIGRNGSGKSTLAKLFNGLIKPDSGEIIVSGFNGADKNSLFEIRKRVGVVFQNPDNQLVASIVEDDVAFGPENLGVKREEIGKRIDFALKAVGMEQYRKSSPTRLSGGQKQKIAIAGVLALQPEILILDESTSMLDPAGRKEVLDVVKELNQKKGVTVISITHYLEEVVCADKVLVLDGGRVVLSGTPKEIFKEKQTVKSLGLELPSVTYIAEKLKQRGVLGCEEILTEEDLLEALCK